VQFDRSSPFHSCFTKGVIKVKRMTSWQSARETNGKGKIGRENRNRIRTITVGELSKNQSVSKVKKKREGRKRRRVVNKKEKESGGNVFCGLFILFLSR
jgi:hypothetical protein